MANGFRKKWIAAVLAILIIGSVNPGVYAKTDIAASARVDCASMVKQDNTYFLTPGSAAHTVYTLENNAGVPVMLTEIRETIGGASRTVPLYGQTLESGGSKTVSGTEFTPQAAGQYPVKAILVYQKAGAENTLQIADLKAAGISISFETNYQLIRPDVMFSGETYTATYRAMVTSHSNIEIDNVQAFHVPDAGEKMALGAAITLPPEEGGLWEKNVTASYQQDQGGYLAVEYTDPVAGSLSTASFPGKRINIDLSTGAPAYSLRLEGESDPEYLPEEGLVTITLTATNTGNASLTGVTVVDWLGHTVLSTEKLAPGESKQVQVPYTVAPGATGTFTGTAAVQGTQETVNAQWNFLLPEGMKLKVDRTLVPGVPVMGEPFSIRYTLTNEGSRDLSNIAISEPGLETSAQINSLAAGATQSVDMPVTLMEAAESAPQITATDTLTGVQMSTSAASMPISLSMPSAEKLLAATLAATPLDENSASIACTVQNIGQMDLKNIEVRLTERDIVMGSILSLKPGESETLTYEKLVIGDLSAITARVDAVLPTGDVVTLMTEPLSLAAETAQPTPAPDGTETPDGPKEGRGILLPVLIVVIVLGLGALAVILWPVNKKKGAHRKTRHKHAGGGGEQ